MNCEDPFTQHRYAGIRAGNSIVFFVFAIFFTGLHKTVDTNVEVCQYKNGDRSIFTNSR